MLVAQLVKVHSTCCNYNATNRTLGSAFRFGAPSDILDFRLIKPVTDTKANQKGTKGSPREPKMDAKGSPRGPTWAPTGASGAQMVPKDSKKAPKGSQAMAKGAGRGAKGGSNETHKNEKWGKGSLARLVGKIKGSRWQATPKGQTNRNRNSIISNNIEFHFPSFYQNIEFRFRSVCPFPGVFST